MEMTFVVSFVWTQFMSPTFVLGDPEIVQDFMVVYPEVFESRQDSSEKVVYIKDGYTLNLRKASVLADSVLLRDVTEEGVVERRIGGAYYERHLFEDRSKQASLLLQPQGRSGYVIRGLMNFTHKIEPLSSVERSSSGRQPHRISRLARRSGSCGTEDIAQNEPPEAEARKGGATAANYALEVYFMSDYYHTVYFNNQTEDRVAYATVFMHSVSLRLAQLDPPIAVIVIAIQGSFTANESYVDLYEDGDLIGGSSLNKLEKYFDKDNYMKNADIVLMATGREMIKLIPGGKSSTLAGIAYLGKACRPGRVSIAEDRPGTFSGINTATHEIGHLLGAHHDGDKKAENCSTKDGYMMSKYTKGERELTFSECSKRMIADFVTWPYSRCLKRRATCGALAMPNKAVMLAGDVMEGAAYCRLYHPSFKNVTYIKEESDLSQCRFRCLLGPENGKKAKNVTAFAMDGTPCSKSDPKKVCRNSVCE
ncbi:venom metalloproteinase BumaMPs1-like [Amblyomma americanum]